MLKLKKLKKEINNPIKKDDYIFVVFNRKCYKKHWKQVSNISNENNAKAVAVSHVIISYLD